jgi:hypothetical protein
VYNGQLVTRCSERSPSATPSVNTVDSHSPNLSAPPLALCWP